MTSSTPNYWKTSQSPELPAVVSALLFRGGLTPPAIRPPVFTPATFVTCLSLFTAVTRYKRTFSPILAAERMLMVALDMARSNVIFVILANFLANFD